MMLRRHLLIWLLFGLCLAVALGALAWISAKVLTLDRNAAEARLRASLDDNARLALWRMDSALTPLIAQENARPYFAYTSFFSPEKAYGRMLDVRSDDRPVASPLLSADSELILLHFQIDSAGRITSPQAPQGKVRNMAEAHGIRPARIDLASQRLEQLQPRLHIQQLLAALPPAAASPTVTVAQTPNINQPDDMAQGLQQQEYQARARYFSNAQLANKAANMDLRMSSISEGVMHPLWVDGQLLLARRLTINGVEHVQGCWFDWPALRKWLLAATADLVPRATLVPVQGPVAEADRHLLAALPLALRIDGAALVPPPPAGPIRLSLLVAWASILLGALSVALLLRGVLALSERRAAFVSAVTHELRTPLTTLRMYSEMLSEGMVAQESRRQQYMTTLRAEADRLGHLVENVLAYSRLERRRGPQRPEPLALQALWDAAWPRLSQRATQAGMQLTDHTDIAQRQQRVKADRLALEQILFNLVDNACKYAASAQDRRIELGLSTRGPYAVLQVRDHGPGFDRRARELFRPFSRSAREAANSAVSGLGLGLALSRRLARAMGGDLRVDDSVPGACVSLLVPLAEPAEPASGS